MIKTLLLCGIVLLICVISSKLLYRFGIPTLIIFLILGMILGSDGIGGIYFDNSTFAQQISSIALVFIMFYGGFGVSWNEAKPIASQAILLATLGVVFTAILVGVFSHFILNISLLEGMLLGAVVSSTDAASVFSILRSKSLNLKGGLASMLEIESGSNDPIAYMLTTVVISLITNNSQQSIIGMLSRQILFGIAIGFVISYLSVLVLKRIHLNVEGLYSILVISLTLLGYSLSEILGGNGFLTVYIIGIVIGNSKIPYKRNLVHFFDGVSWLMQIVLFFTLGLLVFPSQLPSAFTNGFIVAIFMALVARPVAIFSILSWFKTPIKQQLLVSWVGLRGAASIVFATYALTNNLSVANELFNTVFIIALFSIIVQGTLIPTISKKLDLVEEESSVFKTFNDYENEVHTKLVEIVIEENSPLKNKTIMNANIPEDVLIIMIKRKDEVIIPKGSSVIKAGDILVLAANNFEKLQVI
ncbi:K(+)/H(+) antiporter NhaP [Clostridium thermopalmarium DSM 5974]|uniref:K(+)/H(+) antiporter NhaP n=1 Tax=Clostridium thermopalmarium DSM 5974 TaxID=1121340 RepID=A0A2T0AP63_9CLOT|nr:potassium/proton antiporter [Clostridium thermopalmarium]PRR70808.1 K(+)/H(+) antiporter NhaP [Clostridium thermopalmarium DSM 5974]PVZ28732.1 NhaP-type Na+/H+ and K+/H+ antiporter [Clostridium thermopalmarium DSM 5974]